MDARLLIGKDSYDPGSSFYLFVKLFQRIGSPDPFPVRGRKVKTRKSLLNLFLQFLAKFGIDILVLFY
jgi:hypothetical protein